MRILTLILMLMLMLMPMLAIGGVSEAGLG